MLPVKRIVCPTDFSDYSYEALQVADELAQHFSAELVLVHIVGAVPIAPVIPGMAPSAFNVAKYQKELEVSSMKTMKDIEEKRISRAPSTRSIVGRGEAGTQIIKLAKSEKADLVVISTHGKSGLERIFFGSVAEKVVRNCTVPVLTVRCTEGEKSKG